jgi:filamentous hemagglutinin
VAIDAARNVVIAAGSSERHVDEVHQHTEHGMVSSTTRRQRDVVNEQAAIASTLSGQTATLQAGNDVRVTGSQVISTAGTSLDAGNNIVIEAATNTRQVTHTFQQKTTGVMSSGGFGVTLGQRKQNENTNINSAEAAASTIASVNGNVDVHAAHSVRQTGSNILAPAGDVTVTGERVEITEARNITRSQTDTKFEQTGLTVAVSNPVISAVQLAQHMSQAASNTSDSRMQTLAAASTALAAVNAAQALQAGQGQTINGKDNQIVTATDANGNPTATKDANAADKLGGITVRSEERRVGKSV